jgi:hypothetical protein
MPLDIEQFYHKNRPDVAFPSFISMIKACGETTDEDGSCLYHVEYIKQTPDGVDTCI